jgi:hypothetical protein
MLKIYDNKFAYKCTMHETSKVNASNLFLLSPETPIVV